MKNKGILDAIADVIVLVLTARGAAILGLLILAAVFFVPRLVAVDTFVSDAFDYGYALAIALVVAGATKLREQQAAKETAGAADAAREAAAKAAEPTPPHDPEDP